jgi:hypothetical protein
MLPAVKHLNMKFQGLLSIWMQGSVGSCHFHQPENKTKQKCHKGHLNSVFSDKQRDKNIGMTQVAFKLSIIVKLLLSKLH